MSLLLKQARGLLRAVVTLAVLSVLTGNTAVAKPQRIVSLNLCTDQILLQLVARERIAALSFLSQDPFANVLHAEAAGLPITYGNAEEVLALEADLVLVGTYTTRHTAALLRRFGIPVVAIPGANSFGEVAAEIRRVAQAVDEVARGEAIIARFEARLAELAASHRDPRPRTTQFSSGGFSAGSETLYDEIFAAAGHDNGAAQSGLIGYGFLPLEKLIEHVPDVLISDDRQRGAPSLGNRLLQHPAILGLPTQTVTLPARQTVCGGPWNLDAAALLGSTGVRQ